MHFNEPFLANMTQLLDDPKADWLFLFYLLWIPSQELMIYHSLCGTTGNQELLYVLYVMLVENEKGVRGLWPPIHRCLEQTNKQKNEPFLYYNYELFIVPISVILSNVNCAK